MISTDFENTRLSLVSSTMNPYIMNCGGKRSDKEQTADLELHFVFFHFFCFVFVFFYFFFVLREGDHVLHKCFGRGVKVSWSPMTWFSYKKSRKPRAPPTYIPYYLYNARGDNKTMLQWGEIISQEPIILCHYLVEKIRQKDIFICD